VSEPEKPKLTLPSESEPETARGRGRVSTPDPLPSQRSSPEQVERAYREHVARTIGLGEATPTDNSIPTEPALRKSFFQLMREGMEITDVRNVTDDAREGLGQQSANSTSKSSFSMSRDDAIFWVGITLFGVGVPVVFDHPYIGSSLIAIGIIALIWANRGHMPKPPLRMAILIIAMTLTIAVAGYDIYDRNFGAITATQKTQSPIPQKKTIIHATPEYLMSLYDGVMSSQGDRLLQPYVGKWIRLTNTVSDTKANSVWTYVKKKNETKNNPVVLLFDFPKWSEKVAALTRGQTITALCQIGLNARWDVVYLEHCELESQ
jgi:hypothetical protein